MAARHLSSLTPTDMAPRPARRPPSPPHTAAVGPPPRPAPSIALPLSLLYPHNACCVTCYHWQYVCEHSELGSQHSDGRFASPVDAAARTPYGSPRPPSASAHAGQPNDAVRRSPRSVPSPAPDRRTHRRLYVPRPTRGFPSIIYISLFLRIYLYCYCAPILD